MQKEDTEVNLKSVEKKEKSTVQIVVEVTAEEFDKAVNSAYLKNRAQISVPGFRKGKAPRKVVEGMYGAAVFYEEAMDVMLPSVFAFGVEESKIKVVGMPSINDVNIEEDKSVTVTFTMGEYPEITIGEYKGIKAVRPKVEVTEADVDAAINGERYKNARFESVENRPVIDGDYVTLDYTGYVDGETFPGGSAENFELVIGSNTFIPGFELKMHGMMVGEERDLDLQFPEEYHSKDLAGKAVVFHVKVNEIKQHILPELDDDFAKDVSEFDTFAEYKADIEAKITHQKTLSADKDFEDAVLTKLIESVEGDIPDAMIDEYVDGAVQNFRASLASYGMDADQYLAMTNSTIAEFRQNVRPMAEKNVKNTLALSKVVELENIELTEEEIENGTTEIGATYGFSPEEAKEQLNREGVIRELQLRAATILVVANAVAEEPAEEPAAEEETITEAEADAAAAAEAAEESAE